MSTDVKCLRVSCHGTDNAIVLLQHQYLVDIYWFPRHSHDWLTVYDYSSKMKWHRNGIMPHGSEKGLLFPRTIKDGRWHPTNTWDVSSRSTVIVRPEWASYQIRKIVGCACREPFLYHQLQRRPLVSDPGMHHRTCLTHVLWCMSGSPSCGAGENIPGIVTYLARGPLIRHSIRRVGITIISLKGRPHCAYLIVL